jgi:hypothetical protein
LARIVEGELDSYFLRRVLGDEALRDTKIVVAGGAAGIPSLARSILVLRRLPLAVLIDADSTNPAAVERRRAL